MEPTSEQRELTVRLSDRQVAKIATYILGIEYDSRDEAIFNMNILIAFEYLAYIQSTSNGWWKVFVRSVPI